VKSDNLSFSKDVADTIGVEAAVILKFIEENKVASNSIEDITEIILEEFSFMEEKKIVSSIKKIAGLGLIKIKSDKYRKVQLKLPHRARSDKLNIMHSDWEPSREAIEVLELGGIDIDFASLKLKEFRIYWKEKKVQKDNWNSVFYKLYKKRMGAIQFKK
jgi:hypothetical protein